MHGNDQPFVLTAQTDDGARIDMPYYDGGDDKPVVVVAPAMGVEGKFYRSLAKTFQQAGWSAVLTDLRGHGGHSVRPRRGVDYGYREILRYDFPAVLEAVRKRFPKRPVFWLGHSLGGQLGSLFVASNPGLVDGLILVAASSADYRGWGDAKWKMFLQTQLAGSIAGVWGYFPGHKLGFAGLESRSVMLDWSRQARTGRYAARGDETDYERNLREAKHRVLAVGIEGDPFAPPGAVDLLCRKMASARLTRVHQRLDLKGNVHFTWVKQPNWVVELVTRWFHEGEGASQAVSGAA